MHNVVVGQLTLLRMLSSVLLSSGTASVAHELPFHFMAKASAGSPTNQPTAMQNVLVLQLTLLRSRETSGPIVGDVKRLHVDPFHFSERITSPPDLNWRPTAMQKEAETQLMPLSSMTSLPVVGGDGTTVSLVPFHFSLSVFSEPCNPESPTAMHRVGLMQLTPESVDGLPLFGELTTVHLGPAASAVTAVNASSAPTMPNTATLVPGVARNIGCSSDRTLDSLEAILNMFLTSRWVLVEAAARRVYQGLASLSNICGCQSVRALGDPRRPPGACAVVSAGGFGYRGG